MSALGLVIAQASCNWDALWNMADIESNDKSISPSPEYLNDRKMFPFMVYRMFLMSMA